MTFEEIVDQAIEMVRRRGQASYRMIKRQFDLGDDVMEDLKEELLFSHPVVDEDGRGLVWTGATEAAPAATGQPVQPEPQPVIEHSPPAQVETPPVEARAPEAERRQLTVMFCDLVDSTALSGRLDPEDLRDIIRAYQSACNDVIQRFDGYVAQHLGDGLLIYFGYPAAHEDDAQRAVKTGLGVVDAMGTLNQQLEPAHGIHLLVRIGIHTGLVVIGDIGAGARQEQLALGETPNVAARIQGLAQPDTVMISADTYRLTQAFFDCESMGEQDLRGVSQPIAVYRALGEISIQSRLHVAGARGWTPLVGRESETALLFERWEQTKDGHGQVILLSGDAGIGKSRLIQVLKEHIVEEPHTQMEYRSLPYFTNSALHPITDFLQRTLRFQANDTPEEKLEKLEQNLCQYRLPLDESIPLFGSLLSMPVPENRYPPLNLSPQRQRQKTLEAIVGIILELAESKPVLFILEDLHWADPSTLEFIELVVNQTPTASLCVLLTCRPEFQPSWSHRSYLMEMTLSRLSRSQIESIATQVAGGKALPAEIIHQLVDKTDGVPLYIEEMTKAVLESGILKETNGHYELAGSIASLSIPATLQDSLMARLDRLVTAKGIAQYAAVIGRQFSYELLQVVLALDEVTLQRELGRLVEAELVYQRGVIPQATYTFKHALIQDIAYQSLLHSTRQGYHRHIAEVLEERFPETSAHQPELLGRHYTEAGLDERAVDYWRQAGENAAQRSANVEAIAYLQKGLTLLTAHPEAPTHIQQELRFLITLGQVLRATQGYAAPEVEAIYVRAHALCQQVGETPEVFRILWGLCTFYGMRGPLQTALDAGKQLLSLSNHHRDSDFDLEAQALLGYICLYMGALVSARAHVEQVRKLYDPALHRSHAQLYGQDPGIGCRSWRAMTLWLLGYPDQALADSHEAITLAHELAHPFSLAMTLFLAARFHQFRRDVQAMQEYVEASVALCTEQGFMHNLAVGIILRGWMIAMQGREEEGLSQMRQGLSAYQSTGAEVANAYHLALLAEICGNTGQVEAGLTIVTEALERMGKTGDRFWKAEIHRLKGRLLLQQPLENSSEAESCYYQALEVSRHQEAKSLELRAATSLAKLWQSQDKRQEAYDLLAPVYGWFTEGFDTADLIDAKELLDELAEVAS